ncbi:MAG: amino acid adenylation domain-containing protein, partial [Anaerolineae bacterium]|nr:amino acid adenylation domain-containing protein [Anaerolineae bacterium]
MNSLNTVDFLSRLRRSGVQLTTDGQRLRLKAPDGVLTTDLKQEIAGRKAEIITFLGDIQRSQSPTSLQPSPRPSQIPLSSGQVWMWMLEQLEFGEVYPIPLALQLQGTLDIDSLSQALTEIVRRHESLRTTFVADEGAAYQVIQPEAAVIFRRVDLQPYPPDQQESQVKQLIAEESMRPFDLARDLLLRATLFTLAEETYVLLLVVHHIASDAWSQKIMSQELAALYTAFSQGQPSPLPDLSWQYADFALWQRDWLQGAWVEPQRAYWRQQLAGLPPLLQLPTDRPRPRLPSFRNRTYRFTLEADLVQSLRQLNRQTGTTLFMTALAAFQILLARYTGQEDIAVGTLMVDRPRPEFEPLIGLFINTLALRVDLSGNPTVAEVLEQVKAVTLAAYSHRDLPFEWLIEDLQPVRQFTYHPIVQNFVRFVDMAGVEMTLPDLRVSPLAFDDERVGLPDLDLLLIETEDHLEGACLYNIDLFDEATIKRLIGHYQTLLAGMIGDPQQTVYELPLLTEAEHHQLLVEWNGRQTKFPHPQDQCIHQLFERQVEQTPEALAVVFEGETTGRKALTYRQLNQRANQLAHYLQAAGVGPGSRVGLCLERSLEMVIGLLGTLKAGAAYIPLDPAYPENRLKLMIDDSQLAVLLTQSQVVTPTLPPSVQVIRLDHSEANPQAYPNHNPTSGVSGDDWIYVIYTSGSTGQPKGAGVYHRGFTNLVQWYVQDLAMTASERMLLISALSFDLTQKNIFAPLICGGQLILTDAPIFDPSEICEAIQKHAITWVNCTPSMFYHLVDQDLQTQQSQLASLRYAVLGGEPIAMARLANWLARPEIKTKIVNSYGPTECSDVCAAYVIEEPERFVDQAIPIGQPLSNVQIYVLNPHHQMVPVGHTGELCIAGVGVGAGYLNRPQLTATKFIPNPFFDPTARPGSLLYKTGDLVRWRADGQIEFVGRVDHQIKLRGFRIELGEIEASLEEHPAVREAVVMICENQQGDQRLAAYVVAASHVSASAVSATELRPFLAERLPDYMVPALFMPLKSLPLTPSGKVDRKALASQATLAEPESAAPSTYSPFEQKMIALWSELLEREEVGVTDNFFALGGDSVLVLRLVARLKENGISLTMRQFFDQPTIRGLAALLDQPANSDNIQERQGARAIQAAPRPLRIPLSSGQEWMWILDQLEFGEAYNLPLAAQLQGALKVDHLTEALTEIVGRHESLRTIFAVEDGVVYQIIQPKTAVTLRRVEVQSYPAEQQEKLVRQLVEEEMMRPFNLTKDLLLRATLISLSEDDYVLVLMMHHIASDALSQKILIQELGTLYTAFSQGKPSPLSTLPLQYADFALWQREWLQVQGAEVEAQQDYWRKRLAGLPPLLQLPTDRPRSQAPSFQGYTYLFEIEAKLTGSLRRLNQQTGTTMFMTALAAFQIVLARYTGREDIVVGTLIADRIRQELEPLIGLFINTLALRIDLSGNPTFLEVLEQVRVVTQEAYDHRDLPFERLVKELQPARDLTYHPIAQNFLRMVDMAGTYIKLPELQVTPLLFDYKRVGLPDLDLVLIERDNHLEGNCIYNTDLFDKPTVERLIEDYKILLAGMINQPNQGIYDLPLLTEMRNDTQANDPVLEAQVLPVPESKATNAPVVSSPHSPFEQEMMAIWSELLEREVKGVTDNFFALGGDSFLAIRLIARLKEIGIDLTLRQLFEQPTIAGLVARFDHHSKARHLTVAVQEPAGSSAAVAFPPLTPDPAARFEPFPLTEIQRAYWFGRSESFVLGRVATHIYIEIEGAGLDLNRLEWAWQRLIERHDMLRDVILPDGRQQILADVPAYQIKVYDLSQQTEPARQRQLEAIRAEMSHQVLPAEQWPLFDLRASRLTGERTRLHLSFDMLIADAWSLAILFREWQGVYLQPDRILPELVTTFRDYVLAEQALTETELYDQAQTYWFNRLDSLPSAPELPLAQDPANIHQPRFKRYQGQLAVEIWQALKTRARQAGLSPSAVLLTAFAEVLATWSKSAHFVLNLTLFNRLPLHTQVNELVGDFTSLTLLEVDSRQAASFEQRAKQLQQQLWQDLDHRLVGGVRVLQELSRRLGQSGPVLSPVVFTSVLGLESLDRTAFDLSNWGEFEPVFGLSQTPQVWLDHQVSEEQGNLTYNWDIVEGLFPPGLIEAMFEAYEALLVRLTHDETAWQRENQVLTPGVQLAQRAALNNTTAPVSEQLLHTLFTDQVTRQPQAVAVISSDRRLTYRELFEMSNQIGHLVQETESHPDRLVAVVMDKGWQQVATVLGILAGGAAYLPIDPTLPDERRHFLLQEGQVSLALTQQHLADTLPWPEGVQTLVVDGDNLAGVARSPLPVIQQPTNLAYVIYTSGSTGLPKGVMIDHRGAVNTILDLNERFAIGPEDRILALSNLNFDLSVYDIFGTLAAGGTIVIPQAELRTEPAHWLALMRQHQITLWNSVPALMQMLVDYLGSEAERAELERLRLVWLSGDWIPATLPEQIKAVWPKVQLISMGGATEASIWSILYPIETVDPTWSSIPYGKPMRNQSWQVLNERLEPCPIWVPGELYIGGIGLAQGYWRDEAKTNARFITHPNTGQRLYKTGDLGRYLPDGNIEFLGREDFQVKIRGHRIELGEIEAALLQHSYIKEAVVSAVDDARGTRQLVAYLVPASQTDKGHAPEAGLPSLEAEIMLDPVARLDFKLKQPGLRHLNGEQHFDLPQPDDDAPWRQAFLRRQSYRHYQAEPIAPEQLSQWLKCLGQVTFEESPLPKYGYPSAGNLYPVQTYLYLKPDRVTGLEGGFYYYQPAQHRLIQLEPTDGTLDRLFPDFNQAIYDQAAFAVFLVAQLEAMTPIYGPLSRDFCLLEAGYMSQYLMLEALHYQLGLCPIGVLADPDLLKHRLHLDETHLILHTLLGGQIEPSQSQQLPTSPAKPKTTGWQDQLQAYLVEKLPDYMVPAHFVILPELPLTANGKIDRRALPAPNVRNSFEQEFVAPRTSFEIAVAAIWTDVLELDQVSVHDDFFEMGGDSLLATRLVTRIRDEFDIDLPLRSLFEAPTIAGLAHRIEPSQTTET